MIYSNERFDYTPVAGPIVGGLRVYDVVVAERAGHQANVTFQVRVPEGSNERLRDDAAIDQARHVARQICKDGSYVFRLDAEGRQID